MKWNLMLARVKSQRTKLIILLAIIGVGVGGWYWYSAAAQNKRRENLVPITVTRGTIEEVVTAQGKLEPKQYVDVGTQVSGQLKKIHVDIGDTVRKGQLLAEIDPRVYQAQVEAGEAKLNSLRAQLNKQKAEAVLAGPLAVAGALVAAVTRQHRHDVVDERRPVGQNSAGEAG